MNASGHVIERLTALWDGEVDERERAEITHHLEACEACRREWVLLQEVLTLTHAPERLRATPELVRKIQARRPTWWQRRLGWWATPWVLAWLGTAILLGLLAAGWVWWRRTSHAAVIWRLQSANGYVTIQDREGIRDVGVQAILRQGTTVITKDRQFAILRLAGGAVLTVHPFSIITVEGGSHARVMAGRMYVQTSDTGQRSWLTVSTAPGEVQVDRGEVWLEVSPHEGRVTAVDPATTLKMSGPGLTLQSEALAVMKARLKRPIAPGEATVLARAAGKSLAAVIEEVNRLNTWPPIRWAEPERKRLEGAKVTDPVFGFVVEEALWELIRPFTMTAEVRADGVWVRTLTPLERPLPLTWEHLPLEYRELVREYFHKIGQGWRLK